MHACTTPKPRLGCVFVNGIRGGSEGDPGGITPNFKGIRAKNEFEGCVFLMCFCYFAHVTLQAPLAIIIFFLGNDSECGSRMRKMRGSRGRRFLLVVLGYVFRILPRSRLPFRRSTHGAVLLPSTSYRLYYADQQRGPGQEHHRPCH